MKLNVEKLKSKKLIPKGQNSLNTSTLPKTENFWGIKSNTSQNLVEPFNNSKYNFLNNPIVDPVDYKKLIPMLIDYEGSEKDGKGNHIPYKDGKGIDTIGYGLTAKKYLNKGKLTEEEAVAGLRKHIDQEVLPYLIKKPYWKDLGGSQKVALSSYVYNIGAGSFNTKSPALQKALTKNNWKEAAKQMDFGYNDPNNKGLKPRRDKEQKLLLTDIPAFMGYLK